ncbi:MAG: YdcF family protein [Anaerolineaceae bacterium]|nr:YdcF family protein [Anaerolineaceae bacterium]
MFVFLSKIIPQFIQPLGLSFLLALGALLLRKRPKARTRLLAAAVLILYLAGNRWVSQSLARSLEWRYLPPAEIPTAEVIVVLGGGTIPAEAPRPMVEINSAGDRVLYAAQLYRDGKAPAVLASGGFITWLDDRPSTPAEEMSALLQLAGVPEEAIWLQNRSQNTREDALYSTEMLREKGINRVLLVTSAMHMPRSVALFEAQGLEVVPLPVDFAVSEEGWAGLWHADFGAFLTRLLPSASSLSLTTNCLHEYYGMLAYWIQGWL